MGRAARRTLERAKPDDLPAFCKKMIEEFREGRHTARTAVE